MAKEKSNSNLPSWDRDIDQSAALYVGKRMYYQLTSDEGRTDDYYKVPAIITKVTLGERGGQFGSQQVVDLAIGRSIEHGGSFDKANVVYFSGGREPGTCDTLQSEDFTH